MSKNVLVGLPGNPVIKNLSANTGDTGLIPGLGRFPHATRELNPGTATIEARTPGVHASQEKPLP